MGTLSFEIDDDLLRHASERASNEGTSLDVLVGSFLRSYGDGQERYVAMVKFLALAADSTGRSDRDIDRDDLHER